MIEIIEIGPISIISIVWGPEIIEIIEIGIISIISINRNPWVRRLSPPDHQDFNYFNCLGAPNN